MKFSCKTVLMAIMALVILYAPDARAAESPRGERLKEIETWMYQIQNLDQEGAVEALAETDYPLLVLEPGHNFADYPYQTPVIIDALRTAPDGTERILVAYIDIGQAEDYRDYWEEDWVAPTEDEPGSPDFLITVDPDGWSGNYPVAYWRREWKELWLGPEGIVAQLARLGFDGIYLDWVEAYDDDRVIETAEDEGLDPAREMILFVEELRAAGEELSPGFLVIAQNAPYLLDYDPERYASAIDALAVEDTWFSGQGDADWDDPGAGDIANEDEGLFSTSSRLDQYAKYREWSLPVFSVDYCIRRENAALVYAQAREEGLRPLVTRVSLSRLTETPPPEFSREVASNPR